MAEIVGLIFGVMGVAGPLKSAAEAVQNVTKSSKSFLSFFNDVIYQVKQHETAYFVACGDLIRPMDLDLDDLAYRDMFGPEGKSHEKWKDTAFILAFEAYLGAKKETISIAMQAVRSSIDPLKKQLLKIQQPLLRFLEEEVSRNTELGNGSTTKLSVKEKIQIPPERKQKIEDHIYTFKKRVEDFEHAVDRFLEAKRRHNDAFEIEEQFAKRVDNLEWTKLSKRISLAQKSSERLLQILSALNICQCHRLKLWIDFVMPTDGGQPSDLDSHLKPLSSFRFLVMRLHQGHNSEGLDLDISSGSLVPMQIDSAGTRTSQQKYRTLEIRSGPTVTPKSVTLSKSSAISSTPSSSSSRTATSFFPKEIQMQTSFVSGFLEDNKPSLRSMKTPIAPPKPKKRTMLENAFGLRNPKRPSLSCGSTEAASAMLTVDPRSIPESNNELDAANAPPCIIQDLCNLLLTLDLGQTEINVRGLGQLPDKPGYRHDIYKQQSLVEKKPSVALRNLLTEKNDFRNADKLYTAYHLACSLLQLNPPAWATNAWTSSDLMLLPTATRQRNEDWLLFSEGVQEIRRKTSNVSGEASDGGSGYITRLGMLLLEIGQGNPLPEGLNAAEEITEARRLLHDDTIQRQMGRFYWPTVEYCLNWRNRTSLNEDLLEDVVQRRFYDKVVYPLRLYLRLFSGFSG